MSDPVVVFDYSRGRPTAQQIRDAGGVGVMRYLPYEGSRRLDLTRQELEGLLSGGIRVGFIWETVAERALFGYEGGREDAQRAAEALYGLGFGLDDEVPVWFAVDFDVVVEEQFATVCEYFRGLLSWLPLRRVKAYGEFDVLQRLRGQSLASGFWQTTGWSRGQWDDEFHAIQRVGVEFVGGVEADVNHWNVDEYPNFDGLWTGDETENEDMEFTAKDVANEVLFNTELRNADGGTGYNLNTTVYWTNFFANRVPELEKQVRALQELVVRLLAAPGGVDVSGIRGVVLSAFKEAAQITADAIPAQVPNFPAPAVEAPAVSEQPAG